MGTINTNVSSLIAQRSLATNQKNLNTSLQRLSTGLKINSGADDPAGLIASQALQPAEERHPAAINNASRASNVIGTAEGGLNEVSNLLQQLNGLVTQSANTGGLSQDEIAANQLQVDSILSTINRLAGSTTFEGNAPVERQPRLHDQQRRGFGVLDHRGQRCQPPAEQDRSGRCERVANSATAGKVAYSGAATVSADHAADRGQPAALSS